MSTSFFPRTLARTTTSTLLQSSRNHLQQLPRSRYFHSTPAAMVKVGDSLPSIDLVRKNPSDKVNLANELASGKGLIISVPAAFSPGCSETHIPGYIARADKLEQFGGKVYVIAVNDAFVVNAWSKDLKTADAGITVLGDATGAFTEALDIQFDATAILGNKRAKRAAILVEDGKVTKVAVEPDNTGISVSSVEQFLG